MFRSRFLSSFVAPTGGSMLVCGALLLLLTTTRDDVPKTGAVAMIPSIASSHLLAPAETLPSQPTKSDYTASTTEQPQSVGDTGGAAIPSGPSPEAIGVSGTLGETDRPWSVGTAVASLEPVKVVEPIDSPSGESKTASVEQAFLPQDGTSKAQAAPIQASRAGLRQNTSRPAHWKPMALAPSNKLSSGSAYDARVWASLARHKPRVGQSGSTMVCFVIGANGVLRSVRVSGSSGNARLDQMALETVRKAAPFPPAPKDKSAAALSYAIRISFR
jgi:periplasmic protein TonB